MGSWNFEWKRAINDLETAIDLPIYAKLESTAEMVFDLYEDKLFPRLHHNSDHILTGCDLLTEFETETHTPLMPPTRFSWMLHDAKYDPQGKDNEECSAFLARTIVNNIMPVDPIMSTKFGYEGSTVAGRIIKDVDYSYFGLPLEEFIHVTDLIRQEYKHLTDDEWANGRKAFLSSLDPENIFWHPFFKKKFAAQAKANIEKVLE
jgi:predicted metal-dependent HD superfamily phosphohydrolase